jgi:hypothetical protein
MKVSSEKHVQLIIIEDFEDGIELRGEYKTERLWITLRNGKIILQVPVIDSQGKIMNFKRQYTIDENGDICHLA